MSIFSNISQIIFFLTTIVISYFLIERIKKSDWFIRKQIQKIFLDMFEGVFYGVIGLIFQVGFYSSDMYLQPYTYITVALTVVFFRGTLIACYSLMIPIIYSMFRYPIDSAFYYILGIIFSVMLITVLTKTFSKKKRYSIIIIDTFIVINIIIMWLVTPLALNYKFTIQYSLTTFLPFAFSIILVVSIEYLERFLKSANLLYESSTYDYSSFYRESLANYAIQNAIVEYKIKYAYYGLFNIEFSNEIAKKEITKEILDQIVKLFPKKTILFKANQKQYGFFLPTTQKIDIQNAIKENYELERENHSSLKAIENILELVSSTYQWNVKENIAIVSAAISMYGIQEESLPKLQNNVEFALETVRWHEQKNLVTVFDPQKMQEHLKNSYSIKKIDNLLNLPLISRDFFPILNLKNNKTILNISGPITVEEIKIPFISIEKAAKKMGESKIFQSYIAAQTVIASHSWGKTPVTINYPIEKFLDESFKVEEFIASIRRFKQKPKNIVILILNSKLTFLEKNPKLFDIINKLKEYGFMFGIQDFILRTKLSVIETLAPKYIMLDQSLHNAKSFNQSHKDEINKIIKFANSLKAITIAPKILFERELIFLLQTEIENIGGIIFNEYELKPIEFQKKSKIYIEELKKENKNDK